MTVRPTSPIFSQAEIDEVSLILQRAEEADQQEEMKTSAQKVNELRPLLPQRKSAFTSLGKRERDPATWERSVRPAPNQPLPDELGFVNGLHDDIMKQLGMTVRQKPPETPNPLGARNLKIDDQFVGLHHAWAKRIKDILSRKGANLPFEPFDLAVGTLKKTIVDLEFLSAEGDLSNVYLCSDSEENKWVLKMYKRHSLHNLVTVRAAQFVRYATFMQDKTVSPHMITHWNFEEHLENVNKFLEIKDPHGRLEAFKSYVRNNIKVPFLFCPYIEGGLFPLEFDENSRHWIDVKKLFATFCKLGLGNDLKRSNLRIDSNNTLKMIDTEECDEFNAPSITWKNTVPTFHPDPKVQQWLFPFEPGFVVSLLEGV